MKKRIVWCIVFLALLLLAATALGIALPPQTADEVDVPAHTVPKVTQITIGASSFTMNVSGSFDSGSLTLLVTTPSGQSYEYVSLVKVGNQLKGSLSSLPAGYTDLEIMSVSVSHTSTPDLLMGFSYNENGALLAYSINDTAHDILYFFGSNKRLTDYRTAGMDVLFDEDGDLLQYTVTTPSGVQRYNGQHKLVYERILDSGTGTTTHLNYENGGLVCRVVENADSSRYVYDGRGVLRESFVPGSGTSRIDRYDADGNLHTYTLQTSTQSDTYDASGTLVQRWWSDSDTSHFEQYIGGVMVYNYVAGQLPDGSYYTDYYEMGDFVKRSISQEYGEALYDADGNYIGKTVLKGDEFRTYNTQGKLTERAVMKEHAGGFLQIIYNGKNVLQLLFYSPAFFNDQYIYYAKEKTWYLNGAPFNGPAPLDLGTLNLATEIVWYPNNTVCSFGPQFRDVAPGLTDLWYMFTPIDLSRDGTQTFELVGGSVYVLGKVAVTVAGDSVTVNYSTIRGENGHIYTKSEYLNFFPDIKSVKTVVPEEIGVGFAFGKEFSIANDLGGDTNVLMFIRNVATFRNPVTLDMPLTRFYKNLPSRVKLRDAMLDLMD